MQALQCAIPAVALSGLLASAASATPALPAQLSEQCSINAFTITSIEKSPSGGKNLLHAGHQTATRCLGLFSGNDASGTLSTPRPNVGQRYNGLLNGQSGVLDPAWFNNAAAPSPMLDLDKNGSDTDPGWIYLGQATRQAKAFGVRPYHKPLKLAEVLDVQFQCTGTGDSACTQGAWSLQTSLDFVEKMQAALGRNGFDHLAFVLQVSDRFAIYDFDFHLLSVGLDERTPYAFTGTWNTGDFLDRNGRPQQVSHVSVWAREPAPAAAHEVPEPGVAFLVAAGLVGVALARRRRV